MTYIVSEFLIEKAKQRLFINGQQIFRFDESLVQLGVSSGTTLIVVSNFNIHSVLHYIDMIFDSRT